MTGRHDDDDLAPVTDLFGARSRRADRPSATGANAVRGEKDRFGPDRVPGGERQAEWRSPVVDTGVAPRTGDVWPGAGAGAGVERDDAASTDDPGSRGALERSGEAAEHRYLENSGSEPGGDRSSASVFAISDGAELDPADAPRPLGEQRADAERISMKALGRKGVSASEMRSALNRHEFDPDVVEYEVDRLSRVGLLDDLGLATELVDRMHDRKGLGRQAVVTELRRRGIEQSVIDRALDDASDDADDEFVRAMELAEKRAGQLRGLDRATAERRLAGFLMRKGYGSGIVRTAVDRALNGTGPRSGPRGSVRFE